MILLLKQDYGHVNNSYSASIRTRNPNPFLEGAMIALHIGYCGLLPRYGTIRIIISFVTHDKGSSGPAGIKDFQKFGQAIGTVTIP